MSAPGGKLGKKKVKKQLVLSYMESQTFPHLITKKKVPSIFQNGLPQSSIPHANTAENTSGSEGKLNQRVFKTAVSSWVATEMGEAGSQSLIRLRKDWLENKLQVLAECY